MFRDLLQKTLLFAKLYQEKQDLSILTDCEKVPEYKEVLKVLYKFSIENLCLSPEEIKECFVPGCISAATLIESPMISIGYFFIPAGMVLSPHDHPGMLVTSKVLSGKIRRRAMDLVDREKQFELPLNAEFDIEDNPYTGIRLDAIVESDDIFEEGEMLNLTPLRGNVHRFEALEDSVIFDVLTPYYDQVTRFCNFYIEVDNNKPGIKKNLAKKLKTEVSEADKTKKGFKTTLAYLYEPPKIEFKLVNPSEDIMKDPESVSAQTLKSRSNQMSENTEDTEAEIHTMVLPIGEGA